MANGGVDAVHVTIAYNETFREAIYNLEAWNRLFERFPERLLRASRAADIDIAQQTGRTAVFFGFQTPQPIEEDLGLVEIWYQLGVRFMQLTYNNQSLLATGAYETHDSGITRFGKQVIHEMNRVGMVIDMSHSGERSTLEAIDLSGRAIAITHANPSWWHPALRNFSDEVLRALTHRGGMFGFSLYPHHLKDHSNCTLQSFCEMIAECASRYGAEHFGIGSDLCQGQPDAVVEWMRNGRWSKEIDFGEGSADHAGFPAMPGWFQDNRDFNNLRDGLTRVGFSCSEIDGIMGGNWYNFYRESFEPSM